MIPPQNVNRKEKYSKKYYISPVTYYFESLSSCITEIIATLIRLSRVRWVRSVATFNRISKALERGGGRFEQKPAPSAVDGAGVSICFVSPLCALAPLPSTYVRTRPGLSPVINLVFRSTSTSFQPFRFSLPIPLPAAIPSIFFNRPSADREEDRGVTGKFSSENMVGKRPSLVEDFFYDI